MHPSWDGASVMNKALLSGTVTRTGNEADTEGFPTDGSSTICSGNLHDSGNSFTSVPKRHKLHYYRKSEVKLTLSYILFSSRGTTGKMVGRNAFISSDKRRISPWKKPMRPPWQYTTDWGEEQGTHVTPSLFTPRPEHPSQAQE